MLDVFGEKSKVFSRLSFASKTISSCAYSVVPSRDKPSKLPGKLFCGEESRPETPKPAQHPRKRSAQLPHPINTSITLPSPSPPLSLLLTFPLSLCHYSPFGTTSHLSPLYIITTSHLTPHPISYHFPFITTTHSSPLLICDHFSFVNPSFLSPLLICHPFLYVTTSHVSPFPICHHFPFVTPCYLSPLPICQPFLFVTAPPTTLHLIRHRNRK